MNGVLKQLKTHALASCLAARHKLGTFAASRYSLAILVPV